MRKAILSLACSLLAGCELTDAQRDAINAWMTCDECRSGERDSVRAIGDDAVNALALRLRGPPIARYEVMRRKFMESFQPGLGMTEEAYVALMLEGYVTLYQTRSAVALGDIATPRALAELRLALDEASMRGYRADVLRVIESALVSASRGSFTGTISDSVVAFGDIVVVRPNPAFAWDGNESVILHGAPFAAQLLVRRWGAPQFADSLAFVAVGDVGEYQLAVRGVGSAQLTQADRKIRITSLRYEPHPAVAAVPVMRQPLPQNRYLALSPPRDTADYYQFVAAKDTTINIVARWIGLDAVRLEWRTCDLDAAPGSAVSGVVVDENERGLARANVGIVGTLAALVTDDSGRFSFGVPVALAPDGVATLEVRRIGYMPRTLQVPLSTIGLRIGMVPANATRATARNVLGVRVPVPAGSCRLAGVIASAGGKPRIIRLRIH